MNKKGKWSSLTSNYSAQLLRSFCFKIFSTITTSCKDSSKVLCVCATSALLSLLRLCLRRWCTCAMSAAVTQKGGRPEYEGKKTLTSLTLFNFARWAKQCGVAACPAGLAQTFPIKKTREGDLRHSFEKCPPFEPMLEPDTPSSFIDPHVWHVSITPGFG